MHKRREILVGLGGSIAVAGCSGGSGDEEPEETEPEPEPTEEDGQEQETQTEEETATQTQEREQSQPEQTNLFEQESVTEADVEISNVEFAITGEYAERVEHEVTFDIIINNEISEENILQGSLESEPYPEVSENKIWRFGVELRLNHPDLNNNPYGMDGNLALISPNESVSATRDLSTSLNEDLTKNDTADVSDLELFIKDFFGTIATNSGDPDIPVERLFYRYQGDGNWEEFRSS
jgi:hypothetical protein